MASGFREGQDADARSYLTSVHDNDSRFERYGGRVSSLVLASTHEPTESVLTWFGSTTQGPVMRSPSSHRSTSMQAIKMRSPCLYY
jgi:hypothetical protein